MPLTIRNVSKEGRFEIYNETNTVIGYGRAKTSKAVSGYVTLFFPEHVIGHMLNGIRVPINWLDEEVFSS